MATNSDDPRVGDIIIVDKSPREEGTTKKPFEVALVGFPHDEGVRRNGGRLGAKGGPKALRGLMKKVGTVINIEYDVDLRSIGLYDIGDVSPDGESLENSHEALRKKISDLLDHEGVIPFVVGGGNDQSFPNGAALLDNVSKKLNSEKVGIINIDAHLDVRPLKEGKTHSGSPFRQLLEDGRLEGSHFVEFAAQGNQCSAEHAHYVYAKKGSIHWLSALRKSPKSVPEIFQETLDALGDDIFVSFDIDSIVGSDCPGVSAVATIGLTSQEALDMCFIAGKHSKVRLFDLSEYNPAVEEYRTGRLVANMFYFFSMGVAARGKN